MMNINLKEIEKVAEEFGNSVEALNRELKRTASKKCRLKKFQHSATYQADMQAVLDYEHVLKEAKLLLSPKEKFVTSFTQEDVDKLDYDQTMKAIKSIQSKKCNTAMLTGTYGENEEYKNAERIEAMLLEHKKNVKPVETAYIRRSDLDKILEVAETTDMTIERLIEHLRSL